MTTAVPRSAAEVNEGRRCQSPQCHTFNGNLTELTDLGLVEEEGGEILQAFSPIQNF